MSEDRCVKCEMGTFQTEDYHQNTRCTECDSTFFSFNFWINWSKDGFNAVSSATTRAYLDRDADQFPGKNLMSLYMTINTISIGKMAVFSFYIILTLIQIYYLLVIKTFSNIVAQVSIVYHWVSHQ